MKAEVVNIEMIISPFGAGGSWGELVVSRG
jgi:hypothetical protein